MVARRRRPALPLVLRTDLLRAVRVLRRTVELEERELRDAHAGVQQDRQRRDVGELERHVAVEAGVDEPCGRVHDEAEPCERALALEPRDDVIGQGDALERRAEHELTGVEDERLVIGLVDDVREVRLDLVRVDGEMAVVREHPEGRPEPHVEARRLDRILIERIDADTALREGGADGAVGQDHGGLPDGSLTVSRYPSIATGSRLRGSVPDCVPPIDDEVVPRHVVVLE